MLAVATELMEWNLLMPLLCLVAAFGGGLVGIPSAWLRW